MTADETQIRQQAVDAILKGVARKTAVIVSVASACAVIFALIQKTAQPWWFLPASVLFGGIARVVELPMDCYRRAAGISAERRNAGELESCSSHYQYAETFSYLHYSLHCY